MKKTYLFPVIILGLFLSGCGLWTNFTTYFNLYYNASDAFNDAELIMKKQERSIFTFEQQKPPAEANSALAKVVEKCSKLLQFNRKSDYVDDALFMLGKAFYYQMDYLKSSRKFSELIAAYPQSDLALDALLWLGKNDLRTKNYDKGLSRIKEARERALKEDREDLIEQSYIEETSYYIYTGDINMALAQANKLMEISGDNTLSAEVMYEIGKLYIGEEEYAKAADAFKTVRNYNPSFKVEIFSEIEYAKALRELGEANSASKIFEDLLKEDKYKDYFSIIEFESGLTDIARGEIDLAFDILSKVDTSYGKDSVAGLAQYQLGQLMENEYADYGEAKKYYDKISSTTVSKFYKIEGRKRSVLLTKYANLKKEILNNEKQLAYAENPDMFIADSTEAADLKKKTLELSDEPLDRPSRAENSRGGGRQGAMNRGDGRQENSRPGNPPSGDDKAKEIIIPVRPKITADSIKILLVKSKLELGNLFLTEFDKPDSAAGYYNDILDNYSENIYTPRAIYALASCKSMMDDKEGADELFGEVYEKYPQTELGVSAAAMLHKPVVKTQTDPGENFYQSAEQDIYNGKFRAAISKLWNLYKEYPKSEFAAKALYSVGWTYENKLIKPDSAYMVYDTLYRKYPASLYARDINAKLFEFRKERERAELAEKQKQDSITAANKKPDDTVSNNPVVEENPGMNNGDSISSQAPADSSNAAEMPPPLSNPGEIIDSSNVPKQTPALDQKSLDDALKQNEKLKNTK